MVSVRWAVYVDDGEEPIIKSKWYRALWRVEEELCIAEEQSVIEDALMKIYLEIDEIPGIEDRNGQIMESVLHIRYCECGSYLEL